MSGYELSQLLQAVARHAHTLTGELRDAYLDAAERLSGYEQSQALAALSAANAAETSADQTRRGADGRLPSRRVRIGRRWSGIRCSTARSTRS